VTRRFNDSNQYEFCWERAGVAMKKAEKQEQGSKQEVDIERVAEVLKASRSQEDFNRLHAEHAEHLNGELLTYMKNDDNADEHHHVQRYVEDVSPAYQKSRKKHGLYRRELSKIVRGLTPTRRTLEAALTRLLENGTGFLPEFGEVNKAIRAEHGRMITMAT